ncbi:MAG: Ig-like domain-containing protein, partial [Pseudonocardiaceae bacterium]
LQLSAVFTPADPASFTMSMSPKVTFQVTEQPKQITDTRTTLTTTPSASAVAGSAVTLITTVTPATARGTVQFKDGTTNIGAPATVNQGTASTTTLLPAGSRQLTAVFSPTDPAVFKASTSQQVSLTVVESSQAVTPPAQQSGQSLDGSTAPTPAPTDLDGQGVTVLDLGGLTGGQPNDGSGLTVLGGQRLTILRSGGGGLLSNLLRDLL